MPAQNCAVAIQSYQPVLASFRYRCSSMRDSSCSAGVVDAAKNAGAYCPGKSSL